MSKGLSLSVCLRRRGGGGGSGWVVNTGTFTVLFYYAADQFDIAI